MVVPDDLLLAFFGETTSKLLGIDARAATASAREKMVAPAALFGLADCRRCVLDRQVLVLNKVTEEYQGGEAVATSQVQERLGGLQHEPNLSGELKAAMEAMNEAARIAVCKLALYSEEDFARSEPEARMERNLQGEGRLDRTKMMEYFGLCQAALQLPCVMEFMVDTSRDSVFEFEKAAEPADGNSKNENGNGNADADAAMMFPQARLEYVQRLLAKAIGWDPVFVTAELRKIFVDQPSGADRDSYGGEVSAVFQTLVEQMTVALRAATMHVRSRQDTALLNDLGKGGNTRVVSVQYSEFDVDQHGNKIESSTNAAPGRTIDERGEESTDEEKKRRLRLASEAAILQQTILGELLAMDEAEREDKLREAGDASRKFTEEAMALPPGKERIDFLRSMDPATSRHLAMHKLWHGMLQANGGKPPKMAARK
ncbi:unnamed protein product [Pseudo-nitzschia multistriata]|uniref:Uncharacterized protein n=1 Tax=Pseudo-nitzschia multistriata TaxID=183589 RepID=A0A448ZTS0_9STRA|nr:unnamed protein product [Pseudo-nitzschia multistriata]